MKQKYYAHGKEKYKAYFKEAGMGYEVGVKLGRKQLFVSNFIHKKEANHWWTEMNKELNTFAKKFWVGEKYPKQWYCKFVSNHLFNQYYKFVGKHVTTHHKTYTKALDQDVKRYRQLKKKWTPSAQIRFKKAA